MKLVEVASGGGQPWTFDEVAAEKKSVGAGGGSSSGDANDATSAVNGHEKVTDVDGEEDDDVDGGLHMGGGGDKAVTATENGACGPPTLDVASPSSSGGSSSGEKPKVDPVHEVCPELQVKIADLGNACWVVS